MNFPKRVSVLANPQEGSSILNLSRALQIFSTDLSFIEASPFRLRFSKVRPKLVCLAIVLLRHRCNCQAFSPFCDGRRGRAIAGMRRIIESRQLDREISNAGAFNAARNYFKPRALRGYLVKQLILASTADDEKTFQFFSGDSFN